MIENRLRTSALLHYNLTLRVSEMDALRCSFFLICSFLLLSSGRLIADDAALAEVFTRHGIEGTIVISSLQGGQTFVFNESRARQRFSPASTFKIANTLISLEEHAISGKNAVLKWDGRIDEIADWNHDQTLESAFRVSCVWCFQALAERVGAERYRDYQQAINYGALSEPFAQTTFWLDGSLTISGIEQVEFLKQVYQRSLPFSAAAYETLRAIMLVEEAPAYAIRAKSGWATRLTPRVGWYVGYVETPSDQPTEVWFFATNIVARSASDLPLRQRLTREALQAVGIID